MREAKARAPLGTAQAVDRVLREAGGGRLIEVRAATVEGRSVFLVRFVRGSWLCVATVDAKTGDVTTIRDEGPRIPVGTDAGGRTAVVSARLDFRTIWDVQAAVDDPAAAYVATDAGVGLVRLNRDVGWALTVEEHHDTGLGATRHVAPVPGGVVGTTADGRAFRLDADGRRCWATWLPAAPHTLAADPTGTRLLMATNAGALEIHAGTGDVLGVGGGPVRAAAYLPDGGRILAGHSGDLLATAPRGSTRWRCDHDDYPERLWTRHGRVYLAGEGGLKEIVAGTGVIARWAAPDAGPVRSAAVAGDVVFTCGSGTRIDRHDQVTAAWHGTLPALPSHPEAITALEVAGTPWLLIGHRDGQLSAQRV